MEITKVKKQLQHGDFLVIVTDGVIEYLQEKEQDLAMCEILNEISVRHPGQMADAVLNEVLKRTGGKARDDMSVLVCGVWKK